MWCSLNKSLGSDSNPENAKLYLREKLFGPSVTTTGVLVWIHLSLTNTQ